jgi:predicted RNA binding protein YcfA (HicA-like mRNA interferase family)
LLIPPDNARIKKAENNMGRVEKLIERLTSKPTDFGWDELVRLLAGFGYQAAKRGKTGGSRRRFVHPDFGDITLHEPHPAKILKKYQIDQIIETLEEKGLL